MKNLMSLIVIALTLVFTACQKEDSKPQMPDNPYNYLGEQHNTLISQFENDYGDTFKEIADPREAEYFAISKIYENPDGGIQGVQAAKERLGISPETPLSEFNFMNASVLCDILQLPQEIMDIICPTTVALMSVEGNSDEGNAEIHRIIRDAEVQLLEAHQSDEGNGFDVAMAFLAVAKYSADHNQEYRASGKPKWWQIVLADAAGAGIGILAGGTATVPLATAFSVAVTTVD
jgi:hypothetical protein